MKSVRGDILQAPVHDYIVIPCNLIGVMGGGLAKQYRNNHEEGYIRYQEFCRSGQIETSNLCLYENAVFLPTKTHWRHKSRLSFVVSNFERVMKALCEETESNWPIIIHLPKIGSGLGGLDWTNQVRPAILPIIRELEQDYSVEFYTYDKE
jgi:O-acetyl-ADP-ribose deacetylase (regulator of RNase III)